MSLLKDILNINSLKQELQEYREKENQEDSFYQYKLNFKEKLDLIFKDEPYSFDGYWNWAGMRVDFIYPELMLLDKETKSWISTGLAIQIFRPGIDVDQNKELVNICKQKDVPLLLSQYNEDLTPAQITKQIESVFNNAFIVPKD